MAVVLQNNQYHYHWPNYNVSAAPYFNNLHMVKDKITQNFLNKMRSYHGNSKNMSNQQLINALREFSSGNGQIGGRIVEILQNLAFEPGSNKSLMGTGASFNALVSNLEPEIPDHAERILTAANRTLDAILGVLEKSQLNILVSQLKSIKSGTPVSEVFNGMNVSVGSGFYPETQLTLAEVTNQGTLTQLQTNFQELNKFSKTGSFSSGVTLESLQQSFAGIFSDLAGDMYEPVTTHATNIVGEELQKTNKAVENSFIKSGGKVYATSVGSNRKLNGAKKKGDIELVYTNGGITYFFGGTIKLRQSRANINGKGMIKDLHSGMTLKRLVEMTLEETGQSSLGSYYPAALGAIKGTNDPRSASFGKNFNAYSAALDSWSSMKRAATLVGLSFALVGSGSYGDFAGVMVYNNKIYSMYDILNNLIRTYKNGREVVAGSITPGNLFTAEKFNSVHQNILAESRRANKQYDEIGSIIADRQRSTAQLVQAFMNAKVSINLSFTQLLAAGLT